MKKPILYFLCICFLITILANCPLVNENNIVNNDHIYIHFYKNNITIGFEEEIALIHNVYIRTNINTYTLTWTSSNTSQITVDLDGKAKGSTPSLEPVIITLTISGENVSESKSFKMIVIDKPFNFDVNFDENNVVIYVGEEKELIYTVTTDQMGYGYGSSLISSDTDKVATYGGNVFGLTPTTEPVIITLRIHYKNYTYFSYCNLNVVGRGIEINLPPISKGTVEEPAPGGNVFYGTGAVFSATIDNKTDIFDYNITWSIEPYQRSGNANEETNVVGGVLKVAAIDHGKTFILKAVSSDTSIYDIKLITVVYALPSDFIGTWKTAGDGFFKNATYIISDETIEYNVKDEIPDVQYFPCHYIDRINSWQALEISYWGEAFNDDYPSGYMIKYTGEEVFEGTGKIGDVGWHWLLLSKDKNRLAQYSNASYVPGGSYNHIYFKQTF